MPLLAMLVVVLAQTLLLFVLWFALQVNAAKIDPLRVQIVARGERFQLPQSLTFVYHSAKKLQARRYD
jgi:uncharacterized membrane protein YqiK